MANGRELYGIAAALALLIGGCSTTAAPADAGRVTREGGGSADVALDGGTSALDDGGAPDASVDGGPATFDGGPAPIAFDATLLGRVEVPTPSSRTTNLDVVPLDPPLLAVYDWYPGYTDHQLGAELLPVGGGEPAGYIRLTRMMELGAHAGRGVASFGTPDGSYYAPTGWGVLGEYELPPHARVGRIVAISSGPDRAGVLIRTRTGDDERYALGRLEDDDDALAAESLTPLPDEAFERSLAAAKGTFGHCVAWATWTDRLSLGRRCSSLEAPASVDDLGAFTRGGAVSLSASPASRDRPRHATQRAIFTTREGDVVVHGSLELELTDLVWVGGATDPRRTTIVRLPAGGPLGSVARVGEALLAVRLGTAPSSPDALVAVDLAGRDGSVAEVWRPVAGADPGPPRSCNGRARLRGLASGGALLSCDAAEPGFVNVYRLSR